MSFTKLFGLGCAGVLCASFLTTTVRADDKADGQAQAKLGHAAPEFTLTDTAGKKHTLSDYTKDGKIVVLEWFNHDCPVCAKHAAEKTLIEMADAYKDRDVVFLGIDSTHYHQDKVEAINEAMKKWGVNYAVLADFDGKTGHAYGAKTTPHMFIINKDGTLAYDGAIDDRKDTNFVSAALDQILAGETVANSKNKPYGCSVKYAPVDTDEEDGE